jgi:hypothetical protein
MKYSHLYTPPPERLNGEGRGGLLHLYTLQREAFMGREGMKCLHLYTPPPERLGREGENTIHLYTPPPCREGRGEIFAPLHPTS